MKLDDNYFIKQDAHNVILCYEKEGDVNPKTGKPMVSKSEWYYNKLEDALNGYLNRAIDANEDVNSVLSELSRAKEVVRSFFKENALKTK
jgi:hypothetical protein